MRPFLCLPAVLFGLSLAGAAHAERVCTAPGADPAVTVSLHVGDDGVVALQRIDDVHHGRQVRAHVGHRPMHLAALHHAVVAHVQGYGHRRVRWR